MDSFGCVSDSQEVIINMFGISLSLYLSLLSLYLFLFLSSHFISSFSHILKGDEYVTECGYVYSGTKPNATIIINSHLTCNNNQSSCITIQTGQNIVITGFGSISSSPSCYSFSVVDTVIRVIISDLTLFDGNVIAPNEKTLFSYINVIFNNGTLSQQNSNTKMKYCTLINNILTFGARLRGGGILEIDNNTFEGINLFS